MSLDWDAVTKNRDYSLRLSGSPPHCPVIWVRIGNSGNLRLIDAATRDCGTALAAIGEGAMLVEIR